MPYETCIGRRLRTEWFQDALADTRFETWFQPVLDTAGHRILGHECLIRLCDEDINTGEEARCGDEIIAAARTGNHLPFFDSRAMALAIRSVASQHCAPKTSGTDRDRFFINMLPASMEDPKASMRLAMEALAALRQTSGVLPRDFIFEAVDSDLAGDSARLRAAHEYIRREGCGFALDNAGLGLGKRQGDMGSSCFEMIRDLRPDYVKIDQQLVWNIEQPVCASTIRKLVEVSDRYGAKVIAVGVERQRMVENLWLLGVQAMQGYLFGRPSRHIARSGVPAEGQTGIDLAKLALVLEPEQPRVDPANTTDGSWHRNDSPAFADLN